MTLQFESPGGKQRPVFSIVRTDNDKNKLCVYKISRESLHVNKNRHKTLRARMRPRSYQLTMSKVLTDLKNKKCIKTLICTEYIGENAIWVFYATLQFSISFMQPVDT